MPTTVPDISLAQKEKLHLENFMAMTKLIQKEIEPTHQIIIHHYY